MVAALLLCRQAPSLDPPEAVHQYTDRSEHRDQAASNGPDHRRLK